MKTYTQYKIAISQTHFLSQRLTSRSNIIKINAKFAHIFNTKKGAQNSLNILQDYGYDDAKIIEIVKEKKYV